ncbi:MAG: hypothetical protein QXI86_04755 [Ignisphaera sp.]
MVNSRHLKRNEKIKLMKMLKALNYLYSLRHLETLLDIPYQNIWKYVNMIAIPSDEIAMDIITKLNNMKIIDRAISDIVDKYKDNIYGIASDIGFLSIYSLKLEDMLENIDIGLIIPLSEYAIPFASILAWELGAKLCIPPFSRKIIDTKIKVAWYYSSRNNELEFFLLPKMCIDEDVEIFLVDILIDDLEKLKTISLLLKSSNMKVQGIATVYISTDCLDFAITGITSSVFYVTTI